MEAVAGDCCETSEGVRELVAEPMRQAQGRGSRQVQLDQPNYVQPATVSTAASISPLKRMYKRRQRGRDSDSEVCRKVGGSG